jgi:serine/threonine protein kinase
VEARTKVTKEVLCEESRFILANVMAEARYGRQNRYDDIRRVCEGAVSIPFTEYVGFLESAGYLRHDRNAETLEVTDAGERIVNGGNLTELTNQAVQHFKNAQRRRRDSSGARTLGRDPRPGRSTAPPPPNLGATSTVSAEILDQRYEKLIEIGSGGIGKVFRARQVPLDREVAVKEIRELFGFFSEDLHAEIRRRFSDVVKASANLAHPNILPIHDVNLDRDFPYMVSELAHNGSARRLIKDAEEIPVSLSIKYLLQTLHALAAAHKQGVAHRGLKPENMLIDAYGNVKVSDFGMARIVERDQTVIRQVYVGTGSVAYMAPELFSDPVGAGPQTDIYALGIIFYELLTRKLPGRRSPMPSEIDSAIPKGIDDIFDLMTRDDRSERYSTVDDILDDFDKVPSLESIIGFQTQAAESHNPLNKIKFKEPVAAVPDPEPEPEPVPDAAPAPEAAVIDEIDSATAALEVTDEDVVSSADDEDDKAKRRPYSYQQRNKK